MLKKIDLMPLMMSLIFSANALADDQVKHISMHISENAAVAKLSGADGRVVINIPQADKLIQTYVMESLTPIDPQKPKDISEIANSIEFELFQIGENYSSHTIYESPAGICYGYFSRSGVDLTDSTTYYIPGTNKASYYSSLAGAKVSEQDGVLNVRYAPVFNIEDPLMSKKAEKEESLYGKDIVTKGLTEKTKILSQKICL